MPAFSCHEKEAIVDINTNLFVIGLIIVIGLLAQYLFRRVRIPDVLVLIALGAVLRENGVGGFGGSSYITLLVVAGLIYVVFYGALPIRLRAVFSTAKHALALSLLNVIVITATIGVISRLLGLSWVPALVLGALFCVIDGSIINALLETVKVSDRAAAQIQLESAIVDVLVIIGVLSILNFADMSVNQVFQSLTSYLLLSFAIGVIAAMVWSFLLRHMGQYSSAPIATMAVLVIIYAFAEYVKANGVVTVFFFAIMLGNVGTWIRLFYKSEQNHAAILTMHTKSFFRDISFLIRTFLFVYLGMLVDFAHWQYLVGGLGFFLVAYLLRSLIAKSFSNPELTKKDLAFIDAMCAKGLTPTVMLTVIGADAVFTNIIIGGIFSSVLVTSIVVFFIERGSTWTFSGGVLSAARKMHILR